MKIVQGVIVNDGSGSSEHSKCSSHSAGEDLPYAFISSFVWQKKKRSPVPSNVNTGYGAGGGGSQGDGGHGEAGSSMPINHFDPI